MKRPLLLLPLFAFAASSAIAAGFVLADDGCPPPPLVDEARFPEPAVTIDGETVATLGDVNELFDPRTCFLGGYSRAQVAQGFADDFLLAREAKARGAESVEALLADGLPEPTEDELRAEWARDLEENPALGRVEERVEASHILALCPRTATEEEEAAARAKIGALRERVLAGEDFAAVAREASECPSRDRGGALGWFGRGQMVPEFEQAAFSQPVGETGEPVRTEYGFHLVLVTGREPGRALAFEEVREGVSERRRMRLLEERRLALLEPLRAAARIEYDPACDPANPTNNVPVLIDRGDDASLSSRRPIPLSATNVIRRILLRGRSEDGMHLTDAGWTELMAALGPKFSSSGFGYVRFSWRFEDGSFFQIPAPEGVWLGYARFGKDGVWTPAIPPSRTSLSNAFEAIVAGAGAAAKSGFDPDSLDPVPRAVLRACEARPGHFPLLFLHAVRPFGADVPTNVVSGIVFLGPDDGRPFPDRMLAVFNWSLPATTRILRFAGDFSADEPPLRDPNALLYDFEASRVDLDETSDRPALRLRGFYRHKGLPAELVVEIDANGEFAVREARRAKGAKEPAP